MKVGTIFGLALSSVAGAILSCQAAQADTISPQINDDDATSYSREPANAAFFGKGISGRMSEASYMRFGGEQALVEGNFKEAYRKLSKAVQFDPGDPTGHVLLARSMTGILRKSKDTEIDKALLDRTIREWKMIERHDVDITEQFEARANLRKLAKVVKLLKEREKTLALARSNEEKPQIADKVPTTGPKGNGVVSDELPAELSVDMASEAKGKAQVAQKAPKLDGSAEIR